MPLEATFLLHCKLQFAFSQKHATVWFFSPPLLSCLHFFLRSAHSNFKAAKPSVLCRFRSLESPTAAHARQGHLLPHPWCHALHCTQVYVLLGKRDARKSRLKQEALFLKCGKPRMWFPPGRRWNYMMRVGLQWVAKTSPVLKDLLPRSRRSQGKWFPAFLLPAVGPSAQTSPPSSLSISV